MELQNRTPFGAERVVYLDPAGMERLLVVVKGTFDLTGTGVAVADEQRPIVYADTYRGDPARSSLAEANDLAHEKPATDVLLRGFAYTSRRCRTEALVTLRLGGLSKRVRVSGDRAWVGNRVPHASAPAPFERMELTWERAFGGADGSEPAAVERCEDNPAGVGLRSTRSRRPVSGSPLPNLESPAAPIRSPHERPAPVGLGPLAPSWRPRARHAGTYDERWRAQRMPMLPADFDSRYFLSAPKDQLYPGFVAGGEPVEVRGVTPEGVLAFALPSLRPDVTVVLRGERLALEPRCDTVDIDCERRQLMLTWRASRVIHGQLGSLSRVTVRLAGRHP